MPSGIPELTGKPMICDGGKLWPERWSTLRHGSYYYTVTAIGADGKPAPGAVVTIGDYDGVIEIGGIAHYAHRLRMRGWYRCPRCNPRGNPAKLPVNGREYARRRAARKRR